MSLTIGPNYLDDEMLRRKRLEEGGVDRYGNGIEVPGANDVGSADAFNAKYNTTSIFGVDPNSVAATGRERFNIASANAGTVGGTQIVNDNAYMNVNNSIWTQGADFNNPNIAPNGASAVSGVNVVSPTAVQQPGSVDRQNPEGGINGEQDNGSNKPRFGASDIFDMTGGGLGVSPNFSSAGKPVATPEPTGEATLTTTNPEEPKEGETVTPEESKPTDEPSDIKEPEDLGEPDEDKSNVDEQILKQQAADEARKAEEEAARKAAEKREAEQKK